MKILKSFAGVVVVVCLLNCAVAHAQTIAIAGYVVDGETGESLIGALIREQTGYSGSVTNSQGFFSIPVNRGEIKLECSYVGYEPLVVTLFANSDTLLTFKMRIATRLNEVVVSAECHASENLLSIATVRLTASQVRSVPAFMGEVEPFRVIQLLPGVQGTTEGMSTYSVRGGGPEQNLILLDGAPVYNASHLYGFFSIFNADAINNAELIKGAFPARYGGRLSSVLDLSMKEGDMSQFRGRASIGLISTKVMVEGPIQKERASFLLSARRSYLNLLENRIFNKLGNGLTDGYYFYDLNGKVNVKLNSRNRVYLSGYAGKDKASALVESESRDSSDTEYAIFRLKESSSLAWANNLVAARWNSMLTSQLFMNVSANISRYRLNLENRFEDIKVEPLLNKEEGFFYQYKYESGIRNLTLRTDFDFTPGKSHAMQWGAWYTAHAFTPGVAAELSNNAPPNPSIVNSRVNGRELSVYFEDVWTVSSAVRLNAGVHASLFGVNGKTYQSVQPRLAMQYRTGPRLTLHAGYATMQQFIHLLTNTGVGLPTDLWVPATERVNPAFSTHYNVAASYRLGKSIEVVADAYYKQMENLLEYKEGATYLDEDADWQNKVTSGQGKAYGGEMLLRKNAGKVSGWLGYGRLWSRRQFTEVNDGQWYPYQFDRRHEVKCVLSYNLRPRLTLNSSFVYTTGAAVTVPLERYLGFFPYGISTLQVSHQYLSSRNGFRMSSYHRLDLSATYRFDTQKLKHEISVGAYNIYNRNNPFYVRPERVIDSEVSFRLRQVSLFGLIPSITYTILFR